MSVHTHGLATGQRARRKRMEAEARAAEELARMSEEKRLRAESVLATSPPPVINAVAEGIPVVPPLDDQKQDLSLFPVEPLQVDPTVVYAQEGISIEDESAILADEVVHHPMSETAELYESAADPDFSASPDVAEHSPEAAADLAQEILEDAVFDEAGAAFDEEVVEEEQPAEPTVAERLSGLTVSQLENALAHGDFDDAIADLEAAEIAGKSRKGALDAIRERRASLLGSE